jgi:hypothetical protein
VDRPVDFNNKASIRAIEVDYETAYGVLTPELEPIDPASAKVIPEDPLGLRARATKFTSRLHMLHFSPHSPLHMVERGRG